MATNDSPLSVAPSRSLALALGVGGGSLSGFAAESGFYLSGTLEDDFEVIITDTSGQSRFGAKPGGAAPLHLWDAEYGDQSWSTLQRYSGTYTNQPLAAYQEVIKPAGAAGALKYNLEPSQNGYHIFGDLIINQDVPQINYLMVAMRLSTNWDGVDAYATSTGYNLKGVRHVSEDSSLSTSVPLYGQANRVDGNPRSSGFNGAAIYEGGEVYGLDRLKGQWRTWEELSFFDYVGSSSVQAVEVDGNRQEYSGAIPAIPASKAPKYLSMFQKQNEWGLESHYIASGYIYVDDSWCSVIISDQAEWQSESDHQRSLCIPLEWSPGQIKFRLRKRTFNSLSGACLFVRTANGDVIKVGGFS